MTENLDQLKKEAQEKWEAVYLEKYGVIDWSSPDNELRVLLYEYIDRATLAERNRCAEIARSKKIDMLGSAAYSGGGVPKSWIKETTAHNRTVESIANAIRKEIT